jgi:hypothetical protein
VTPLGGLVGLPAHLSARRRAQIAVLGPLVHLAQALAFMAVAFALDRLSTAARLFAFIHASLALLQVSPSPPFDGAAVLEAWVERASRLWLVLSIVGCAAIYGVAAAFVGPRWVAFPFVWTLASSVGCFARARLLREDAVGPAGALIAHARRSRLGSDLDEALRAARAGLGWARSPSFREAAIDELALVHIARGDLRRARVVLCELPASHREPFTLAALALSSGKPEAAVRLLERERARGEHRAESTRLLVDALISTGDHGGALGVAVADQRLLSIDELEDVVRHARATGHETASLVIEAILSRRGTAPA